MACEKIEECKMLLTSSGNSEVTSTLSDTIRHRSSGEEIPPGYRQAIDTIAIGSTPLSTVEGSGVGVDRADGVSDAKSRL